eukprot:Sspe_Gene.4265::Locus_1406_Transcript_2_2_Confidence_0.750_Length_5425::g.4265::m.4265
MCSAMERKRVLMIPSTERFELCTATSIMSDGALRGRDKVRRCDQDLFPDARHGEVRTQSRAPMAARAVTTFGTEGMTKSSAFHTLMCTRSDSGMGRIFGGCKLGKRLRCTRGEAPLPSSAAPATCRLHKSHPSVESLHHTLLMDCPGARYTSSTSNSCSPTTAAPSASSRSGGAASSRSSHPSFTSKTRKVTRSPLDCGCDTTWKRKRASKVTAPYRGSPPSEGRGAHGVSPDEGHALTRSVRPKHPTLSTTLRTGPPVRPTRPTACSTSTVTSYDATQASSWSISSYPQTPSLLPLQHPPQ